MEEVIVNNFDTNKEITRFKVNNYTAYSEGGIVVVDERWYWIIRIRMTVKNLLLEVRRAEYIRR